MSDRENLQAEVKALRRAWVNGSEAEQRAIGPELIEKTAELEKR